MAGDTERRLAGDVLDAIVRGELAGPELARRLGPFGLSERVAAIVLKRSADGRGAPTSVEAVLWAALRDEAAPALVASVGPLACALVPGVDEGELFALADRVAAAAEAELHGGVRVGIGRAVPASTRGGASTRRAARSRRSRSGRRHRTATGQARRRSRAWPPTRISAPSSCCSSLQDDEALRLFCDSILGPIEASEGHYGGELMRSLEAFIEENGQWERAARRLYCHRHTLRYRIRRVEELTGRNLGSARDRIEFWLALRGRELVN